jgi:hypothetical protein
MRFYRYCFWMLAIVHLGLGLWFCFAPQTVLSALDPASETHQIFIQTQGLFYWMLCAGFAYAAESPEHAIPVVALMTLVKALTPLFSWVGFNNHDLSVTYFSFELTLDLVSLPFLISYFFWFFHTPRPDRFIHLVGLFGQKK